MWGPSTIRGGVGRRRVLAGVAGLAATAAGARWFIGEEGIASARPPRLTPADIGSWSSVQQWPLIPIHASLLPNGRVLSWASKDAVYLSPDFGPFLWDPASPQNFTKTPDPGYDLFCAGQALMADGRLFVAGGHIGDNNGVPYASIYDPGAGTWTRLPDMNLGRWYPTVTTLASGDLLVQVGVYKDGTGTVLENELPQVWQVGAGGWRDLTNAGRFLWYYPWTYQVPNGRLFHAGPMQDTQYLDPSGTGSWTPVAMNRFGYRDRGSSVMYDDGKILIAGGGDPPTASCEVIDLNAAQPAWRSVASMAQPRRHFLATLLPDGRVLALGGSSGPGFDNASYPVYATEVWDPATERWTSWAKNQVYRGYHSTSLLLPDGRVLLAGGAQGGPNAELFSPPYLFKGTRPSISAAPAQVGYGQTFLVGTPSPTRIARVTWLRLGAVTHSFDQDQRINRLRFTTTSGGLNVTAPANANLCPPGHYMLFILDGQGLPSVARIIRIG